MNQYNYMTFKSVSYAMKVETALKRCNLKFKTIPVPRSISSSCGLCIKFLKEDMDVLKEIIAENSLVYEKVYTDI